ncbi:IS701 family transposase [Streptomyces sp. NL15-2K]|uniref:IS701 family transposase n=1 Tax=Streptomyces sp. NL15-2K TaxID=376149 RepID=UPI000FF9B07C|nr:MULTISPECIES: IS701 family transposase [Actinomycetes]WKX14270.1 IS701 family transposase [Kutzneria buriramensis]GCB53154.1 Cys-tRNA(Pro) deacylase ybaK [Streptomyces sp. NL15-2K]
MAERLPDGNEQNVQQFVNQSTWDPGPVRRRNAERMVPLIGPDAWAVDDVSFPKRREDVGGGRAPVLRSTGQAGQLPGAVSVHAVSDTASCPLQWRLFVPQEWAQDAPRRHRTGVPQEVGHREKWRLALDTFDELAGWGLVPPVVMADAGYGQNADFRHGLSERGIDYVVAVRSDVTVHPHDVWPTAPAWSGNGRKPQPRYRDKPLPVAALVAGHGRQAFTEVTWREGSRGSMRSRFVALRMRPAGVRARRLAQAAATAQESLWDGVLPEATLLAQWPEGADAPTDYWLSSLPAGTALAELVRLAKIRWRIEHDYRELKHGLGLDHLEGRSWTGWHHHVTLVTAAHAFLTEQRLAPKADTANSPSTRSSTQSKTC